MILASKSPRRKEILENFGFNLEIVVPEIDENSDKDNNVDKIMDIAYKKVLEVAKDHRDKFIIGADTIVEFNGKIIGKPKSVDDAKRILKDLSGKSHNVITGFCIMNKSKNILIRDYAKTEVIFRKLDDDTISWYIGTKEPMDKAGAYGIQGKGAVLVEKINGDFFTVMGLPIGEIINKLIKLGISLDNIYNI